MVDYRQSSRISTSQDEQWSMYSCASYTSMLTLCSAEELLDIFADPANATDSPDIGPPPVAHFEEGDPIKFDPLQDRSSAEGSAESTMETQPKLSANLETRRKRRESSHRRDVDVKNTNVNFTKSTASIGTAMPMSQPLKSGAKRKFSIRDDDGEPAVVDESGKQDFQFNRRGSEFRINDNDNTKPIISRATKAASDKASQAPIPSITGKDCKDKASGASATVTATGRKALGPSKSCK